MVAHGYSRRRRNQWQDGKRRTVEERLVEVLIEVEARAVADEQDGIDRIAAERERAKRAEEARLAAELRRLYDHHDEHVRETVEAWRFALDIRALAAELRDRDRTDAGAADWRRSTKPTAWTRLVNVRQPYPSQALRFIDDVAVR